LINGTKTSETIIAINIITTQITTMTHRISQKSLPIPDVNVRAMINVPNGTAAQRRKRQKFRTKILKKLSNLRTKDVLEMNSEGTSTFIKIITIIEVITSSTRISSHTSF